MDSSESKEVESNGTVMENKEIARENNKTAGVAAEEEEEVEASPHKKKRVEEKHEKESGEGCAGEKETAKQQECQDKNTCGCPKLEAEAIKDNRQLLEFRVRSRDIDWRLYVQPLNTKIRSGAVYLERQADFVGSRRRPVTEENRRELLVCHDMMGNYLEDRHFHSSEKYDDYRFVHWSAVDYFCYFSHEYVTIPPSGWLNAAHRHGVPVLGTFIVEAPGLLDEVLATEESVSRTVQALTRLCQHFGFEGWLVNVEVTVPQRNVPNLYRFVRELTAATEARVPHGRVFWYDSVLESGELLWQNELNPRNVEFFRRSHGTLINYAWNEGHLERSAEQANREQSPRHRVFMGLDVFGRSRKGGFHSLETMEHIANNGFSAGIFAPGWAFETLSRFGYNIKSPRGDEQVNSAFLARNEAWWARIWPTLATHPYSSLPFFTDFCVGSGRASYERGFRIADREQPFFNLARQSLQPSVPLDKNAVHHFDEAFSGGCSLLVTNYERAFRLFVTDFELTRGVLLLGYAYKLNGDDGATNFDLLARVTALTRNDAELYVFCGEYGGSIVAPQRCYLSPTPADGVLPRIHPKMPPDTRSLATGWQVRYYLVKFDGPVRVQDIGVKCQRPAESRTEAQLGALFVEALPLEGLTDARTDIPVYGRNMWDELRA
ncbi:cytosolic endo-beta-N-acetylglucosaminidase isoform X1 [Drosophila biarmipes]|uniref:cytosolic endo-beta-N-acetylglucosaminidase isoform X1 n=1 Tax=Drosophila biarmipes TaxID=125945 RepID=UPI0007E8466B|nr:cytosolic endo-beta-N-acetylglucosaminidase isoform X1 [Drosophila biarmipes]